MTPTLAALAEERFVSLTTFRKSGEPVSTPVWVAADGDALVVTTPAGSGKIKRLRNNPKVELLPSDRRGRSDHSGPAVVGVAQILTDPADIARLTGPIRTKYGLEFKVVMAIERLVKLGRRADRFILRITSA